MTKPERTELCNVDLEIVSGSPLEPLVEALGDHIDVLHVGDWDENYHARLEVSGSGYQDEASQLIDRFVSLVESLPEPSRKLWDNAITKEFDIGIQAAVASPAFGCSVGPATLEGVSRVKGTIVVTVYAPDKKPKSTIALTWKPGRPRSG